MSSHTHQSEEHVPQLSPVGVRLGTVHARRVRHLHKETLVDVEILQQKGDRCGRRQMRSQQTPELSCCQAQAKKMAAERQCCRSLAGRGAGDKAGKQGRIEGCFLQAVLSERQMVPSVLNLVLKVLKTNTQLLLPVENMPGDFLQPSGRTHCGAGHAKHEAIPAQAGSLTHAAHHSTLGSPPGDALLTCGLAGAPCWTYRCRALSQEPSQIRCVAYRATYLCRT